MQWGYTPVRGVLNLAPTYLVQTSHVSICRARNTGKTQSIGQIARGAVADCTDCFRFDKARQN